MLFNQPSAATERVFWALNAP